MIVNYKEEVKKARLKNIETPINNKQVEIKLKKYCEKYDCLEDIDLLNSLITDADINIDNEKLLNFTKSMAKRIFAIEPSKQNIYEKTASEHIIKNTVVENFKNLPSNVKLYVNNGNVSNKRVNDVKSIDFTFNIKNKNFYVSHKYINEKGGSQDNQFIDIKNFLKNCNNINEGDNYFIAICDGDYFNNKLELLKDEYSTSRIFIITIESFNDFISDFISDF